MALVAKDLYDFSTDESSAADDDDFHAVPPNLMIVHCVEILGARVAMPHGRVHPPAERAGCNAGLGALLYRITTYPFFMPLFFQISFEDPLNTKPIIELTICPKRRLMQLLKSFFFGSVLEFVKNCF